MLGLLASKTDKAIQNQSVKEHLLITRYDAIRADKGEMMRYTDIKDILAIDIIGIIPESQAVLKASNTGDPVIFNQESDAGIAYADTVSRILGEKVTLKFAEQKKGLLSRLFSKEQELA